MTPGFREGQPSDAPSILQLIEDNLAAGHLLPRTLQDLERHAHRFVVIEDGRSPEVSWSPGASAPGHGVVIGCAELAPLSRAVAEVRSLVVADGWRGHGLGSRLIAELSARATRAGFSVLCAFTHDPHHFVRLGFSIAPHVWFPEKVALDCVGCAKFRACGQFALALPLTAAGLLPALGRQREPLTATATSAGGRQVAMPPSRLRVIA
jgi:amino-acid N-acetyltransferase